MSSVDSSWPVATVSLGDCATGTVLWRFGGQLMVTIVCKASFALVPNGEMTFVSPETIARSDMQSGGPMSGTRRANELAPQLRAVDVVMTGHAHPPTPGATQATVRLTIQNADGVLLDKIAYAVGDLDPNTGERRAMRPVSLGYERAYGGIGCQDNPLGVGFGVNALDYPNLLDTTQYERVASFAPLPAIFPARKSLLGDVPRSALSAAIVELPDDFDWRYFQSAPEAQRVASLRGGEWLTLEGVVPALPRLQTRLPVLSGAARVHSFHDRELHAPEVTPLCIDMLHIDADELRCHVVWRGSFPLADESALGHLVVVGGLESEHEPIAWPDADELGFRRRDESLVTEAGALRAAVVAADFGGETVAADALPPSGPLPAFLAAAKTPTEAPEARYEGTVAFVADMPMPRNAAAPFVLAEPGRAPRERVESLPGAPWAGKPTAPVVVPGVGESTISVGHEAGASAERALEERRARLAEEEKQRQAEEALRRSREQERERILAEEAAAKRALDERIAAEKAAEQARREAEERRLEEAARFDAEQREAQRELERRAAQKAAEKREQTDQVKRNLYGAFKRKT